MNIWKGEELFTDNVGKEITPSVKSRLVELEKEQSSKLVNILF